MCLNVRIGNVVRYLMLVTIPNLMAFSFILSNTIFVFVLPMTHGIWLIPLRIIVYILLELFASKKMAMFYFERLFLNKPNLSIYWVIKYWSNINNAASNVPPNGKLWFKEADTKWKDMPKSNGHHSSQTKQNEVHTYVNRKHQLEIKCKAIKQINRSHLFRKQCE